MGDRPAIAASAQIFKACLSLDRLTAENFELGHWPRRKTALTSYRVSYCIELNVIVGCLLR